VSASDPGATVVPPVSVKTPIDAFIVLEREQLPDCAGCAPLGQFAAEKLALRLMLFCPEIGGA
jgi:hypothetical protein